MPRNEHVQKIAAWTEYIRVQRGKAHKRRCTEKRKVRVPWRSLSHVDAVTIRCRGIL